MNKVELIGRLTRNPEVRYSQGEKPCAFARFILAVKRNRKHENGEEADFISCVAVGKIGETAEKYLHQGMRIAVVGKIQTGNYTNKEGQKVYTTEVFAEEIEFLESSKKPETEDAPETETANDEYGFMTIPEDGQEPPFK